MRKINLFLTTSRNMIYRYPKSISFYREQKIKQYQIPIHPYCVIFFNLKTLLQFLMKVRHAKQQQHQKQSHSFKTSRTRISEKIPRGACCVVCCCELVNAGRHNDVFSLYQQTFVVHCPYKIIPRKNYIFKATRAFSDSLGRFW